MGGKIEGALASVLQVQILELCIPLSLGHPLRPVGGAGPGPKRLNPDRGETAAVPLGVVLDIGFAQAPVQRVGQLRTGGTRYSFSPVMLVTPLPF